MREMKMIIPSFLQVGDKVKLVATARKVTSAEIEYAVKKYESWGLEVDFDERLFAEQNQFAGTDTQRRELLQEAIDDKEIKAIFCVRGGYGSVRVLHGLDWSVFKEWPKWIVGFSDVTVLHSYVVEQLGIATLHAAMPLTMKNTTEKAVEDTRSVLFGEGGRITSTNTFLNRKGSTTAQVVGGNLSIIYSLQGSDAALDTKGKILFIEDLDEYLYHIDRMMMNLKRSGMLSGLAGLIVGGMSDMNDNAIAFGKMAEEIIAEHVSEYDYPVCFHFPAGHGKENYPLLLGVPAEFEVGADGVVLEFKQCVVPTI